MNVFYLAVMYLSTHCRFYTHLFDFLELTYTSVTSQTTREAFTPPQEFPFPFTPYDIQTQLMSKIYEALELGKIGIFESPTGTVSFASRITNIHVCISSV